MFDLIPFGRNERNLFQYLDNVDKSLFDGLDTRVSRFRTDILDKGDRYLLEAELTGLKKEDIHLDLEGDILTIRAEHTEEKEDKDEKRQYVRRERRYGSFSRSFDVSGIKADPVSYTHLFLERESLIILGDHVTLESGTGCVHTAPGHGVDDFNVCRKYPELPIVVPVDDRGFMTEEAGPICAGMATGDASKAIAARMEADGTLFAMKKLQHQYPHCWRCKQPVLFRATEQWFCSVESFRDQVEEAIHLSLIHIFPITFWVSCLFARPTASRSTRPMPTPPSPGWEREGGSLSSAAVPASISRR